MRRVVVWFVIAAIGLAWIAMPGAARGAEAAVKVAIIVGPVGEELTPVYIGLAEQAAAAAESRGATVVRAYSPEATETNVLAAVANANIVVYLGHGVGAPNPYGASPSPETTNGWGLNGRSDRGHADSYADGSLVYRGEAWIAAHARPAPGWVMIYSNACYAPGASEGWDTPATPEVAAARVAAYSRGPLAELGASGYFATDFHAGAAHLVGALLDSPRTPYGEIFASEPNYFAEGVTRAPHAAVSGAETWLQRSAYFDGTLDYWYAFAGDPTATFAGGVATLAAAVPAVPPLVAVDGLVSGIASHYPETAGWEGKPTVALPIELGGKALTGEPAMVQVCGEDRCALLPVVDTCPCYVGTLDQRIANLSHAAWRLVTDAPLETGLIYVEVDITPGPAGAAGADS